MSGDNNRIADARERVEQAKRRRALEEKRDGERQRKTDTRRAIIIGNIVLKYFPQYSLIQPQLKRADNNKVFAELDKMASLLADDKDYIALLRERARSELSSEARRKNDNNYQI